MPLLRAEERVGTTLGGKYRLDKILGEGGMGVVFQGTDLSLSRKVAVKFLHPQFAQQGAVVERFLNEAKAAARVASEHVVAVHAIGNDPADDAPYMVLEFLDGESLAARLERGPLRPEEALSILCPVMETLEHAHQGGIVHRDLKPDNIFLASRKGKVVPKILDFGIAKLMEGSGAGRTATGTVMGTAAYMAPEQGQGRGVGPHSDVWSMGVIWYQALTGRFHYEFGADETSMAMVLRALTEDPMPLSRVAPQLDPRLCAAIDGALQRDPQRRYRTMQGFLDALEGPNARASAHSGPTDVSLPPIVPPPNPGIISTNAIGTIPGVSPLRPRLQVLAIAAAGFLALAAGATAIYVKMLTETPVASATNSVDPPGTSTNESSPVANPAPLVPQVPATPEVGATGAPLTPDQSTVVPAHTSTSDVSMSARRSESSDSASRATHTRGCGVGDHACVIRALGNGRARTLEDLIALTEAQRAQGSRDACASARQIVQRFPRSEEVARYRSFYSGECVSPPQAPPRPSSSGAAERPEGRPGANGSLIIR